MFKQWSLASCKFSWDEEISKYWVAWGTCYLHGKTGNFGCTIKWFPPLRFEGSKIMDCDLRRCNFSAVKSVQLTWICFVAGRSPTTSKFLVLCLTTGFPPRVVFAKDKHLRISHVRSFFAPYKFSRSIAYNSDVSGSSLPTSSPGLFPEKMGTRLHHHHHHHHHY